MEKEPRISVIMSVYNSQDYLEIAIDSILSQTYTDFEFIIVNDGSTDNSSLILENFARIDSRIRIINKENEGLTKALNIAIQTSRGEFIARFDSDDISISSRLEKQVDFLEKHPKYDMIASSAYFIDKYGNIYNRTIPVISSKLLNKQLRYINPIIHPSVMLRRSVLERVGLYNENIKQYCEDYNLWLRISEFGKIKVLFEPLIMFRMHSFNMSNLNNLSKHRREISLFVRKKNISTRDFMIFQQSLLSQEGIDYNNDHSKIGWFYRMSCKSDFLALILSLIKSLIFLILNDRQIKKIYFR